MPWTIGSALFWTLLVAGCGAQDSGLTSAPLIPKAPPSSSVAVSAPIVSDVPVLIIEGAFDAATAPEWVELITPDLKNSQVVAFPFTGHSVLGKSTCAFSIVNAFLDDPTKPVDGSCAARITLTLVS